jgi:predicted membrane-bound spermidine synthase
MDRLKTYFLYLTVFTTGAAVLIIEIMGTRVLAPFYGSTIYVWSSLIAVTLGFLALGYWLGGKFADIIHLPFHFYFIILLAGISITALYQYKWSIILFSDFFGVQYGPLPASTLFFGPTFFLLGMVTPYAIRLVSESVETAGTQAGRIFAFSTVGSVVGAIASGFVIIPLLPLSQILYLISFILIALSAVGIAVFSQFRFFSSYSIILITVAFIAFAVAGYFLKQADLPKMRLLGHGIYESGEVLFEKDTFIANYRLVGIPTADGVVVCLLVDATRQGCVGPRSPSTNILYGFITTLQKELVPEESDVLMLGAGIGVIPYYGIPESFSYDIVDINPHTEKIFEMAGTKTNPERDTIIIDEARSYLIRTDKKYDLIWNDTFGNAKPVSHLMTKEAYELARERLKPGGVYLTSLLGEAKQSDALVSGTVSTLQSVFENVLMTKGREMSKKKNIWFLASDTPLSKDRINAAFGASLEKSGSQREFYMTMYTFAEPELEGTIITDDYNPVEYFWAQYIKKFEDIAAFRLHFKHLTPHDFIY